MEQELNQLEESDKFLELYKENIRNSILADIKTLSNILRHIQEYYGKDSREETLFSSSIAPFHEHLCEQLRKFKAS